MHYAMIIKENSEQNLDIWPNLTCVMTFLSKSGSSLTSFNISWAFRPKISEKIAWHEPTDMPTSSATSLIVIRRFSITIFLLLQCFHWLLTCWAVQGERRHSPLLDLLWRACTTYKHFFDLQYTHRMPFSTLQVFLSTWFHFSHKIWCIFFDPLFSTAENRQHTQNTSNLYASHKQTKNAILLNLWTYFWEKCANIGKKNRKSHVHSPRNLKIHLIFLTDLVCND